MQQQRDPATRAAATRTQLDAADARAPAAAEGSSRHADSSLEGEARFLTCLVTPKITFSLPRRPHWKVAEDISQDDLRDAFLSRFPVRFEAAKLAFRCATPALDVAAAGAKLVFRVSALADGGDDERVLLSILQDLDKAYSTKYERQLEEARADLLSSSSSFTLIADEIREGQLASSKRWEKEIRMLKEQMLTNQKRTFLLEYLERSPRGPAAARCRVSCKTSRGNLRYGDRT